MDTTEWATSIFKKLDQKLDVEATRLEDKIPYIPENGHYIDMGKQDITWWTNGFWSGMMWLMYHATGKEIYRKTAEANESRLDAAFNQYTGLHHDVGFMWRLSAVADYQLTGNERSKARGMHAADLLAGRYNPRGKYLRSWNRDRAGWVIVDSMLNIPLLYWARDTINDPRFGYIAEDHADTVMNNIVRPDGSVNHIAIFDPTNGELLETPGGQGYESGSSWSRGQAWALYGFALSYAHTQKQKYLDTAKRVANYFIANVAQNNYDTLVDFRAPEKPILIDSSAGACAACGLLEIAKQVPEFEKSLYLNAAVEILKNIEAKYTNWDLGVDGIIGHGTPAYHDAKLEVPLIYSDFYFTEAILRLLKKDFLIW
ncbi:glycoside hydrolase family 88 protein [Lapidilactobacillus bayanensis]|uniref:glycoside hydrolase family 88 protein n=1 Tax=Lapidilactobacillus bayanensis TaxID=2485998 RepID=UPI001CDC10E3|nr:glycoside hydrolase family 88 protein [Lapidilactobacillus bayanensis]